MNNSFPVCITAKYDQQIIVLEFDAVSPLGVCLLCAIGIQDGSIYKKMSVGTRGDLRFFAVIPTKDTLYVYPLERISRIASSTTCNKRLKLLFFIKGLDI
jgi:hypothetical protein